MLGYISTLAICKETHVMTERRDDISGLHSLKGGHSYLPAEGPDVSILEAFPSRFPERRYVVSLSFPEFTSLCPVT